MISLISHDPADLAMLARRISVNNLIGPFGSWVSHYCKAAFGLSSFLLSLLFANVGLLVIKKEWKDVVLERACSYFILLVSTSSLFSLIIAVPTFQGGGAVGNAITRFLTQVLGLIGTWIVIILFNLIAFIFSGIMTLAQLRHIDIGGRMTFIKETILKIINSLRGNNPNLHITVEKRADNKGKMPWITKKRVMVYETEVNDSPQVFERDRTDGPRYLEMKGPDSGEMQAGVAIEEPAIVSAVLEKTPGVVIDKDEIFAGVTITIEESGHELDDSYDYNDEHDREMDDLEDTEIGEVSRGDADDGDSADEPAPAPTKNPEPRLKPVKVYDEISINKEYIIPTDFLTSSVPIDDESWQNEVRKNSLLLINTLAEFGVESKVVNVNRGPVLTLYEMQIAPGIKVNKIVGLADDIAMALAASRVRVVAPIPGKSAIGVEIPNRDREMVTLGDIIKSDEYQKHHGSLKVGLGKDILGKPVIIDLKKLPHLLIAGATGSGKSVCVNSIITSLIYNYDPDYVRLILIDPKMVELQLYDGGPHLLTPVITDPLNTPQVLRWAIHEMERRYRLLSELNTRDIERYNQKVTADRLGLEKLSFIVIIIDELADLMMIASKEVEGYITRIAQKARAVGIHLVFATQRPSVDIITGIIKANIPARIAFQVAQKTDSRTIIDQNGAEKLLGKGDMLYQSPMSSFPTRIQGALITEEEILEIATYVKRFGNPTYIDIEESLFEDEESREADSGDDELFVEALKIVEETKKASASYLQRRLSIGYNRAARIIEQMEDLGYVGPQQGSKPREVFI